MTTHRYDCRVRFSDVDIFGHVNNVKYFEYYQEARIAFWNWLGLQQAKGFSLVVARVDVDYKRPILFRPEPYVIESRVTAVGTSSFTLTAEIRDGNDVLSRSESRLVTFDDATQRSRPLTEPERAQLLSVCE